VREELQLLKELQDLDKERQTLEGQRQQYVTEQEQLQSDLSRVQEMVDSLAADIAILQGQRKELAGSFGHEQENISRSEERLPLIKTQKEYVALLKEVDTAKKLSKELQDQIDVKDQELAALNSDKEEKDAELSALNENVEARNSELAGDLGKIDGSLGKMGTKRDGLLEKLPKALRKRYDLLLARRGGIAIVEASNGACMGCHMHLPPQLYNSLFVASEVQSCPHCNRLLFVEQG
jgi:predicted  nucleic acid-binding Zn-ribbon protein